MDCDYTNKLKNLDQLMENVIGTKKKIVDKKITRLTAPGENNCSLMLKVDLTIKNEENSLEELNVVAKVSIDGNIGFEIFGDSFKHEIAFYNIVAPVLLKFQSDQGVEVLSDLFPKLLASRLNLHGQNEEIDTDIVVVFENLNTVGYKTEDRMAGFDLETTKLIIKDLAAFHALPIALKRLEPDVFRQKLLPHLGDQPHPPPAKEHEEKHAQIQLMILELLEKHRECSALSDKLRKNLSGMTPFNKSESDGLFSTISHGDMWVTNILIKYENGKPIKNKFIDFQVFSQRSLSVDLFFFLMTSVKIPVIEANLDHLLEFYYEHFIENLKKLRCDTTDFTKEKFLEDLTRIARREFKFVILFSFVVVFGKRGGMFNGEVPPIGILKLKKEDFTREAEERGVYVVKECAKRGWIV